MSKCEKCLYGRNAPILDRQLRGGKSRRLIDTWECDHPDWKIKKLARQKGWAESCPNFEQRGES
jgi:hypothetical protein